MERLQHDQPTFEDLELLAEVSQLLTVVDLDHVLERVITLAAQAVGATKSSLFLHSGDHIDWDHIFTKRNLSSDESVRVVNHVMDKGFAGWVLRNKRGDIITDTDADDRWLIFDDDPVATRSALCVPFLDNDEVIAVVTLEHPEAGHFSYYHLRLMTIIANQATIAIRNAQLVTHLRTQRRQLQTVLQSITDILLVVDRNGHFLLVNDPALHLLEVASQQELVGSSIHHFRQQDNALEQVIDTIQHASRQDVIQQAHWSFSVRSEKQQKDYQVTMAVWQDASDLHGYVIVMHDVTTLRDLHRFKDEMLRVASHDLRNPLALIAGYADMIVLDTDSDESPIHDYVDVIKRSIDRMGTLIDDLLRVEKVRNSPLELHEQIDLAGLSKLVTTNMEPATKASRQRYQVELKVDNLPRIMADPVLLRQSMENLIGNAVKYTPENGTISVFAFREGDRFNFVVQDTGIGIPKEDQPYVFESFYRVGNAKQQKGSGLGLSLVKNVIERHGGEVWLESILDEGSRFGFWLPLTDQADST